MVDQGNGFVDVLGVHQSQHRTKDFRLRNLTVGRHILEDGRFQEVALLIARNTHTAAVYHHLRSFCHPRVDETLNAGFALSSTGPISTLRQAHTPHDGHRRLLA
jgi:hypothetical protein